ncbi:ABC transporter ATP-binding protein [Hyunsoonleella sp. SJ7]|uniref:ABC transporter ATP-binding protein n=1 Tax=Hyunsoonleella aquatilis TaxID=2762758 RepID=A0A923HGB4_9FLAO|nr:ABC transporter ATP-binding protein [Hyunsoonleella aquatilis]MBC3757907.1 ABC transporter ATP-binding protein [Hyunsoonleella aquatilis]
MISIQNLSYSYSKKSSLFKDLNFNQEAGNIVGLLGKNGAGKSTLLNVMSGLLDLKKAKVSINEHIPFKREPDFLNDVFLVTETPFYPSLSIKSYVKVYGKLYKNFDQEKMSKILDDFELDETQKLHKLSHGQQKKFTIAFALATNCKLLLLDEPTNGLDIHSKSVFRKVLISSVDENQLVVISTHQVRDIEAVIDKIVIMDKGDIIFEKEVTAIVEKIQFKRVASLAEKEVFYSEKSVGGHDTIMPVNDEEETPIDIELLFKAVLNKADIKL